MTTHFRFPRGCNSRSSHPKTFLDHALLITGDQQHYYRRRTIANLFSRDLSVVKQQAKILIRTAYTVTSTRMHQGIMRDSFVN